MRLARAIDKPCATPFFHSTTGLRPRFFILALDAVADGYGSRNRRL